MRWLLDIATVVGLAFFVFEAAGATLVGARKVNARRRYNTTAARRARIAKLELELGIADPIYAIPPPPPPEPYLDTPKLLAAVAATRKRRRAVFRTGRQKKRR